MAEYLWMREAACLGKPDAMWDESTPSVEALRVCFRCPVRRDCVNYGLARPDASDAGVLGATGLYDREKVRAGSRTVEDVWASRLAQVVQADWDEAMSQEFVRLMPRLELV